MSIKTRWVRHVACIGRSEMHIGFMWINMEEKVPREEPDRIGRIILM
jgi:hypothetical protein